LHGLVRVSLLIVMHNSQGRVGERLVWCIRSN